jgi:inhibitor of KinA
MPPFRIQPAGDAALVVELPERIDPAFNAWCVALAGELGSAAGSIVRDIVVGYRSVTVYYDPLTADAAWLESEIRARAERLEAGDPADGALIEIPVCYGGDMGPDLADVAAFAKCSAQEAIDLHAGRDYRVYMVGFVPGFAYMAEVAPEIAAPRRTTPRTAVPAGSVAIAGGQTGIYPAVTPGGWNLIGRTTIRPYDPGRREPFLFKCGDRVRFRPVLAEAIGQT